MVAMNVRNIKVQMKSDMFGAFSEMFFLSKCHVTGVVLDSDKLIFTWLARARERERGERERVCVCARARVCVWGGGGGGAVFTLRPFQIQANTVMSLYQK